MKATATTVTVTLPQDKMWARFIRFLLLRAQVWVSTFAPL
jgi:hypothetical protein